LESDEEVLPAAVLLLDELDGLLDLVVDAADEAPEAAEAFTAALQIQWRESRDNNFSYYGASVQL